MYGEKVSESTNDELITPNDDDAGSNMVLFWVIENSESSI